jgi:hypothetical protein
MKERGWADDTCGRRVSLAQAGERLFASRSGARGITPFNVFLSLNSTAAVRYLVHVTRLSTSMPSKMFESR